RLVAVRIGVPKIFQHPPPLGDHSQKTLARCMILLVSLKMIRKLRDALTQQGDFHRLPAALRQSPVPCSSGCSLSSLYLVLVTGLGYHKAGRLAQGAFSRLSAQPPPAAGRSHWRALTRKPPIRVLRWTSVIFRSLSMVCPVSMLTGSAASRGVAPGTGSCVGAGLRLGFVGFLRLLIDLRGDFAFRRWRRGDGGHGALYRRGLGGSRGCWKSTLTLLRLQLLQASVDGLAHMVLHVLQIREHNRNGIALGAFPAALA